MTVSSATPERIPDIETLRRLTKSVAMLDAIICPEWEYRYFSYDSKWGPGEEMASMRDGCGNDWFLLFTAVGAALKGLAHEYPLAGDAAFAARIQETVPAEFSSFLKEPAFSLDMASFCIWRRATDSNWTVVTPAKGRVSPEADGSADLIDVFDGDTETYRKWAVHYFEREIPAPAVEAIYEHQPLNDQLVASLNEELSLPDVLSDAMQIDYPATQA